MRSWEGGSDRSRREVWGGGGKGGMERGEEEVRGGRGGAYPGKGGTHCKVMVDDWYEILGQLHVKLHIVSSVCSGLLQGGYGVLCRRRFAT